MQRVSDFIGQNIAWVLITILIIGFIVIANQSKTQEEKDPAFVTASSTTNMFMGDEDAPVDIIVYTDFLCPFCAQFANETMPAIEEEFIKTGKAKVEVRPLAMIGVDSGLAAQAAYCAADQDAFWSYHDATYAYTQREIFDQGVSTRETSVLTASKLTTIMSKNSSIDTATFSGCLADETYADRAERATADANALGVTGTPYVMVNGNHVQGVSLEVMSAVIKAQL